MKYYLLVEFNRPQALKIFSTLMTEIERLRRMHHANFLWAKAPRVTSDDVIHTCISRLILTRISHRVIAFTLSG